MVHPPVLQGSIVMVKFLVIRFSSIGDIVLTTPLVRALKTQVDEADVHFLTKPAYREILSSNPYLSKVHTLSENTTRTVAVLKEESFDYIIDLQNNIRSLRIKRALRRMYFTVNKLNLLKWLLVNFRINRMPDLHIVDRYMATARLFDVKDDGKGLDYFIREDETVPIAALPEKFQSGYAVFAIGAKHETKKMPEEKLISLIPGIRLPVILVGGPEDREAGSRITNALSGLPVYNGCGTWSVNGSASVIRNSLGVITHDTGMMHIAAAFRKKIITVWGNTVPAFGMYAYRPDPDSVSFEVEGLSCRPCSKLGKKTCPKKHFRCMTEQDPGKIAESAHRLFSRA